MPARDGRVRRSAWRRAAQLILLGSFVAVHTVMALEEPRFERLGLREDVELRRYAAQVVAETRVKGEFGAAGNEGFRRLAGYIFGGNRSKATVAMTAPVAQTPQSEKIAMTAPVAQRAEHGEYVVSFVMPSAYTLETLPVPNDARVALRAVPSHCAAVLAYTGGWSEKAYAERVRSLQEAVRRWPLEVTGEPTLARFDPPWVPWFMRRNEVVLPVRCPS